MCDPVSVGMFALSAAGTVLGVQQQAQAYSENAASAVESGNLQSQQLSLRQQQEDEALSNEIMNNQVEAARARATARAAAGEAGVSGLSVDALLADFAGSEARYRDSLKRNREMERNQIELEKRGVQAQTQSRINSVDRADYLGAAFRIGQAGLGAVGNYEERKYMRERGTR